MKLIWKMKLFLYDVFEKHKNHNSILKIKEHHVDVPSFDFKPITAFYVEKNVEKA